MLREERPEVDEEITLDVSLKNVRRENYFIMLEIERNSLRFILKQTFNLLCELRTNLLSPKNYFILYNQVANELIPVQKYMTVEISRGREPWDIYESVQQCRYVIPRLYLMILSGAIYIENSPEKFKEITNELLEQIKEAQSPIRGIFVRYYLAQMMKGRLPEGDNKYIKEGFSIKDTINFLMKNLEEMNILWIRMSLNASIDEISALIKERMDIKVLIKDVIEIISKLEGITIDLYEKEILPKIVEIVFMYDDYLSQEFIMECIFTLFPENYNIKCLDFLLLTLSKLVQGVSIKKLFVNILEKMNKFYKENIDKEKNEETEKILNEIHGAYPIVLRNYTILLNKHAKSIQNMSNILEINLNFIKFCVNCAPEEEKLISINYGLNSTIKTLLSLKISILFQDQINKINEILSLALESIYSIFEMPDFVKLFNFLDYQSKKKLAIEIINNLLNINSHEKLDNIEKLKQLLIYLTPLIKSLNADDEQENDYHLIENEQYTLIKLLTVFKTKNIELLLNFFIEFKNFLTKGGKIRIRKSLPCFISYLIIFCKNIFLLYSEKNKENEKYDISILNTDDDLYNYLSKVYQLLFDVIKIIEQDEPKFAFKYGLLIINQINMINISKEKFCDLCLSFFNEIMQIYKKFGQEIRYEYFIYLCQNLIDNKLFSNEICQTILKELINEARNMARRKEQCYSLLLISQICFIRLKDGNLALESLLQAKKIAGFSLSNPKNLVIFVNMLNICLYYIEADKENIIEIKKELIDEIIEYIQNYIITIKTEQNDEDISFLDDIEKYFNNTIKLINDRKNKENNKEIYKNIVINFGT